MNKKMYLNEAVISTAGWWFEDQDNTNCIYLKDNYSREQKFVIKVFGFF